MNAEIIGTYDVIVREDKSIEEIMEYAMFDTPELPDEFFSSDRFPRIEKGHASRKRIVLFGFYGNDLDFKGIVSEISKWGYRPASVWDLACLAGKERDLQTKHNLVSLGEVHSVVCGYIRGRHISVYPTQKILDHSRTYVFVGSRIEI
jgi:hypothetical protein